MSIEELSTASGETVEVLRRWQDLGLIGTKERFDAVDLECIRLIRFCRRRGIGVEAIARAEQRQPGFLRSYVNQLYPGGIGDTYSPAEAAAKAGLEFEQVSRLLELIGAPEAKERLDEADVETLRGWQVALDAGLPEEALLQLVRVYVDALGRVAEAEARLFHFYVHERLRDGGLAGPDLQAATDAASQSMRGLVEPALLYFHRNGMAAALREDMLMHVAEHSGRAESREAPAQLRLAIAFLDLASFTPMTESMGDVAAAQIIGRFSELVREVVGRHHGRVVERIGDAFMLVFSEPGSAVACALEIERRASEEAQFPAVRGGIHFGPVLYREGGYVGSNVNVASRVAGEARRHQVLVTEAVREAVSALAGVDFTSLGKRPLKGLAEELELFEARPSGRRRAETVLDPVCGMELTSAGVAARLALEGTEHAFCSERCLRTFLGRSAEGSIQ